jgi:hypothetical protein
MIRNSIRKLDKRAGKPLLIPMVNIFIRRSVKKAVRHEITIDEK